MATTNSFQGPELDKIQVPIGSEIGLGVPVFGFGLPNNGITEIVDPEQLIEANQNFNYAGFWDANNNDFYNRYKEAHGNADEAGKQNLNKRFDYVKNKRDNYHSVYQCLLYEKCSEGQVSIKDNRSEEWTLEDLMSNQPLLQSIQRTNGAINRETGEPKTKTELLAEWASDQRFLEYNIGIGKLGNWMKDKSEEEIQDLAVQYLSFQKTIGTSSKGGLPTSEAWTDILGALAVDPTNYVGFGLVANVIKGVGKLTGIKTAEKVAEKGLGKFFASKLKTKSTFVGASYGALYSATDNLSDQDILINAKLQEGISGGELLRQTLVGTGLGAGFGFTIAGGGQLLSKLADDFIFKNNLDNAEFIKEAAETVTDEKSLKKFLKRIGYYKPEVQAEVKKFRAAEQKAFKTNEVVMNDGKLEVEKDFPIDYDVPIVVRNTEADIISTSANDRFNPEYVNDLVPPEILKVANQKLIPDDQIRTPKQQQQQDEILAAREAVNKIDEGQAKIDSEYVNNANVIFPALNKWGYNTYETVNRALGTTATRFIYGADTQLVLSGARGVANSMFSANVVTDINVAKMSGKLDDFAKKNADELGDTARLIENGMNAKNITPIQKEYLKIVRSQKTKVLTDAYKAGVITKAKFNKYMKDRKYIPRVWNTSGLMTPTGSEEFAKFLRFRLDKDEKSTMKLIQSITGNKDATKLIVKNGITAAKVKAMWQRNSIERTDLKRSTHLENERQFVFPKKFERELDQFMAPTTVRWSMMYNDIIKRTEYARRFGAKDEKFIKFIKKIRSEKTQRAADRADDIEEIFYTAVGDAAKSNTIQSALANPAATRAIAKINAIQNHKLGLAALPNLTQAFVNGSTLVAKNTNMLVAPFRAVKAIVQAIVKTKKHQQIVHNTGVLGEMDLSKMATENAPSARILDYEFKGPGKFLNEPTEFLRAVGFMSVEKLNRRAGAQMGWGYVQTIHTDLMRLVRDGKALSVKAIRLQKDLKQLGISDPLKTELSPNDITVAAHMFNKMINFSGESGILPVSWQGNPWVKLITKFKSFMFYQARFLKRHVADELFLNYNPQPLLVYLAAGGLAGNAVEQARAFLTGKNIEENRTPLELLINGVGHSGSVGLWFETMASVQQEGSGAASTILGPTAADSLDLLQDLTQGDIDSIIMKLTPNVPGKSQLQQKLREEPFLSWRSE